MRWRQANFIEVNGRSCLHCDQPRRHQTGLAQITRKLYEVGDQREQVARKHCMLCQRLGDETIYLWDCFEWSWNWISALTYTICGVNEIYQQLSRTRVRGEMMGLTSGKLFRTCHQYPDTVEHVLSGCPEVVQRRTLFVLKLFRNEW